MDWDFWGIPIFCAICFAIVGGCCSIVRQIDIRHKLDCVKSGQTAEVCDKLIR